MDLTPAIHPIASSQVLLSVIHNGNQQRASLVARLNLTAMVILSNAGLMRVLILLAE
jgi:hypothetical protein